MFNFIKHFSFLKSRPLKMVLIVRGDIKMTTGKIAAQCSHATILCYESCVKNNHNILQNWCHAGQPKIVLRANSYEEMETIYSKACDMNIISEFVKDAGKTQLSPGTITVLGLGPDYSENIDLLAIKSQAELNGCICRTYLLASYERVFTTENSITGFLIHRQPFQSIYKNLTNVFPNFITGEYIAIMPNSNNEILVGVTSSKNDSQILLKKNGKVSQFDNEKSLLETPMKTLPCCCVCSSFGNCARMDVRTVKTALNVLEKRQRARKQRDKLKKDEDRLRKVEEKLEDIMNLLQTILTNQ